MADEPLILASLKYGDVYDFLNKKKILVNSVRQPELEYIHHCSWSTPQCRITHPILRTSSHRARLLNKHPI